MKRLYLLLCLALSLLLAGCGRDADVDAFIQKLDTHTAEIVKRVDGSKDHKAGVAAAQQYLDSNKDELRASYAEIKGLRGYQVKDETVKRLSESVMANGTKVAGLKLKYMSETMSDSELDKKLDKLTDDYSSLFDGS